MSLQAAILNLQPEQIIQLGNGASWVEDSAATETFFVRRIHVELLLLVEYLLEHEGPEWLIAFVSSRGTHRMLLNQQAVKIGVWA